MKLSLKSPVLVLLTAALVACGNGTTPPSGGNKLPEVVIRNAEGKALTSDSYIASGSTLKINTSDADGSVTKVSYSIDGGAVSNLTPSGTITLTLPQLSGGTHTVNVTVTDNAGGVTSGDASFKVDAAAPNIDGVTLNGKAISSGSSTTLAITDAAVVNAVASDTRGDSAGTSGPVTITIYEGTTARGSSTNGQLSVDLSKTSAGAARTAGVVSFTIKVTDSVGYTTSGTFSINFVGTTGGSGSTAPSFTWLAPAGDYVSGGGTVQLRATAVRNGQDITSQLTYSTTCGTVSGTTWTLGADCTDNSIQTLTATVTDGGTTYSSTRTVTVDNSNPTVQITSPQQGQTFTQNPITVSVVASDAVSGVNRVLVEASRDGGAFEQVGVVSGTSGNVIWAPSNGSYVLRATATDNTGRTTTTSLGSLTVLLSSTDNQDPTVTALNVPSGVQRGTVTATISVSDPAPSSGIAKVELFDGGTSLGVQTTGVGGIYTFSIDTTKLTDTTHNLRAVVTDNVGRTGQGTATLASDNTAPTLTWLSPTDGSTVKNSVNLNASASDVNPTTVTYTIDGSAVSGSSYTFPSDGTHTITATAKDAAGNTTTSSIRVTSDATAPVIAVSSPAQNQAFSTAPIAISASATDNLSGMATIEATIGLQGQTSTTLGVQSGGSYSANFTPVESGTYVVNFIGADAAGNTTTVTRTFTYSVTTPPTEKIPNPVISVVGTSPYTGNMSVNVSGNFDTLSTVDRMILQITDSKGFVDNSSYVTPQSQATFSVDTTKFANGPLTLELIAYTKSGLRGIAMNGSIDNGRAVNPNIIVQNILNPVLAVASPSNGALVTTPILPAKVTLTKNGDTAFTFTPSVVKLEVVDYRGRVVAQANDVPCTSSADQASFTCDYNFDIAALPADQYTLRTTAQVTVNGVSQTLISTSRFTSNTTSVLPPAATIRFPAITNQRAPAYIDSSSGFMVNVSDNTGVNVVEARIVGPFDATKPLSLNGTTQCLESQPVGSSPVDVLLLNQGFDPPLVLADVILPNLDISGSAYIPDNNTNERYDLRVTVVDVENNRNIQCIPVYVDRTKSAALRPIYSSTVLTDPVAPITTPGKLNYVSGTWTLGNITNSSRVAGVLYVNGVQKNITFSADATGSASVTVSFGDEGVYTIQWLIEDMTTGVVTSLASPSVTVKKNE